MPFRVQASEESLLKLAERYNINPKTVQKWKGRRFVEDLPCGPKPGYGSVLTEIDEAVIVETRRKTLLPLDDLFDLLLPLIPVLSRSNLHRCLQRHQVSRLAELLPPEEKAKTKAFKDYRPGYFILTRPKLIWEKKNGTYSSPLTGQRVSSLLNCMITSAWKQPPDFYNKRFPNILLRLKKS